MKKIKVLITDDSPFAREVIANILSSDEEIEIIGQAENGFKAIYMTRELKPDIVTMDIEMPMINGLEAIEKIMKINALPIIVVTSRSDAHVAYQAIINGALEVMEKPNVASDHKEFIKKIKTLSQVKISTPFKKPLNIGNIIKDKNKYLKAVPYRIIAIAASTGGPQALLTILSSLPENFPFPLLIAQHISFGFLEGMINWLSKFSKIKLKIAEEGEYIKEGYAYFIPPEKNMGIDKNSKLISILSTSVKDFYHPSCDLLLSSVGLNFGEKSVGVILTGMGDDGVQGIKEIKERGGFTIAQDENTSIIFGMPKIAIENSYINKITPLQGIAEELLKL
ncbi:MAG: chemotaxis-specific protein-glutamate methyltransferase CheB [Desulfobacterales bacterium]|nr:chemotaxis-specific protein-glutamate methyltransferase CheB [Desulfobacterales bacterium]